MQTVRFSPDDASEKQFVAVLRKNVNDYFKQGNISVKANSAMVIKTIMMLLLYMAPFVVLLLVPVNTAVALLLVVIMGFGVAGVGMGVMHDACHGAYSRRQWVNDLLSGTLYMLGTNVLNWKLQHNVLHHTYTNISGMDEDIDSKGPIRLSENMPLKKYHRFQYLYVFFFYGLMTLTMFTNDFHRLLRYTRKGLLRSQNKNPGAEFFKMLVRKIVYLAIILGLPLWFTDYSFWQVFLGFFIMHWVAGIILSFIFQMAHVVEGAGQSPASGEIKNDWHVHQLLTTSDFARNNRLLSWYVGGLNFQIEHHLFPGICHVHYKKIAPIVEQTAKEFNIPYNLKPNFRSALHSHFRRLRMLGVDNKILPAK